MKHCSPTARRYHGRPLKRLLDTWDRNGSTSGPIPWQIYDDDDDGLLPLRKDKVCWNNEDHTLPNRLVNTEGHDVCIIQRNLSSLQFSTLYIHSPWSSDLDWCLWFLKENAGIICPLLLILEDVSNISVPHSFPHISPSTLTLYVNLYGPKRKASLQNQTISKSSTI